MSTPKIVRIVDLSPESFGAFGRILTARSNEPPDAFEDQVFRFFVLFTFRSTGWQIGYLEQLGTTIRRIERHPNTPEVFSPLTGAAVLILTTDPKSEESYRAFALDEPIVLDPGVWHGVVARSAGAAILVVENSDVVDEFYELPRLLKGEEE